MKRVGGVILAIEDYFLNCSANDALLCCMTL